MKTLVASAEPPPRSEHKKLLEALLRLQERAQHEVKRLNSSG